MYTYCTSKSPHGRGRLQIQNPAGDKILAHHGGWGLLGGFSVQCTVCRPHLTRLQAVYLLLKRPFAAVCNKVAQLAAGLQKQVRSGLRDAQTTAEALLKAHLDCWARCVHGGKLNGGDAGSRAAVALARLQVRASVKRARGRSQQGAPSPRRGR